MIDALPSELTDTAIKTLLDSGIDRALIYDYKPKSLSELEKVIGKKHFGELLEDQIVRPMGALSAAYSASSWQKRAISGLHTVPPKQTLRV